MKKKSSTKKSLLMYLLIAIVVFVVASAITYSIFSFIESGNVLFSFKLLKNKYIYMIAGVATLITLIGTVFYSIYYNIFGTSKLLNKSETAVSEIYGAARLLTEQEVKEKYGYHNYNELGDKDISGYVVNSVRKRGRLFLSIIPEIHALSVGITGDGKSLRYLGMCLQLNAKSRIKPSMFINDSKGELYDKHSKLLKEEGYDIFVFNLRNPESGNRFNYMSLIWDLWMDAKAVQLELTVCELDAKHKEYLRETPINPLQIGEFYANWRDKQLKHQASLSQRAEVLILELARILIPHDPKSNDRQWNDGAQGICAGIIIAMLEDADAPINLGITREKFCIEQISNIANNQREHLAEFLQSRPVDSKVFKYCGNIINNSSSKTVDSYLSTFLTKLRDYLEGGINYVLSATDIDFKTIISKPTAVFVIVPDEFESRDVVSTMLISQLYNDLIHQASKYENQRLPRPFYFMLDEFGNLPMVPNFHKWITISKSRRIFFNIIVQAISQLESKYGQENTQTILQNCHLQMLMGTNETKTAKHFQEKFGTKTVVKRSANYNPKTSATSYNGSSSLEKADLITLDKIMNMPIGSIFWQVTKNYPAKTNLLLIYDVEDIIRLGREDYELPYRPILNNFYDIAQRNALIKTLDKGDGPEEPDVPPTSPDSPISSNTDVQDKKERKPKSTNKPGETTQWNQDIFSDEKSDLPDFRISDIFDESLSDALNEDDDDIHKKFFQS